MRDYSKIDGYLNNLLGDIYPQPQDGTDDHYIWAQEMVFGWVSLLEGCKSVLDVGCGEGFCQPFFEKLGITYKGIALGADVLVCKEKGYNVESMDFSFLDFPDESFDLIFSRHSLEHSPMPLLTLKEWHRVSKQWLCVIVPNPSHFQYEGMNHYYVLHDGQWRSLFLNSKWNVIWYQENEQEIRYMLEKIR